MNYEEKQDLAKSLMGYYGVFSEFWDMVSPRFVDDAKKCPTAQVRFNKENHCVDFEINRNFWDACSAEKRIFIICHECLHVLLKHGKRASSLLCRINADLTNQALDIPINEMLAKYFGISRKKVDPQGKFCWADTVFDPADKVPTNKSFEWYFNKMKKDGQSGGGGVIIVDHSYLSDLDDAEMDQIVTDFADSLSEEAKELFREIAERENKGGNPSNSNQAGSEAGGLVQYAKTPKPQPKKKWETIIAKWARKFIKKEREESHWLVQPRRNALLNYGGMFFPNELEINVRRSIGDVIDVWIFLDTSGSCVGLKDRFFKAFESLPKETFNVRAHCFDTNVYKLSDTDIVQKKLYGFGGTTFSCIENYIQAQIKKEGKKFPTVFVLTDGCADVLYTTDEKNWYFFLSQNTTHCIPKNSKRFMLQDFE